MRKVLGYAKRRIGRVIYKSRRFLARRLQADAPAVGNRTLYPIKTPHARAGWIYHDENWVRVTGRWDHRRLLREGRALVVADNEQEPSDEVQFNDAGSICIDAAPNTNNEWVYLCLNPLENSWRNYRWEFVARRESDFRELQFGFRYVDFYNRYRFRHENNHIAFDKVVAGAFENCIGQCRCVMELAKDYHYVIEVKENRFVLRIDENVLLDEFDFHNYFPRGSIAFILWEDNGETPIRASFKHIKVVEI